MKRSPLRADPEKVRAFVQRGREHTLGRTGPISSSGVSWKAYSTSGMRKRKTIPRAVRREALDRSCWLCVVCMRRATSIHHVLPVRLWPEFESVADNMVGVCEACHSAHERAFYDAREGVDRRIPREALPACAVLLADAHGLGWYIDKAYPA